MWGLIALIVSAVTTLLGVAVILNWDEIREEMTDWLHEQNLNESVLMDVWIEITLRMDLVVRKIKVKTAGRYEQTVSEKTYRRDEIDDPDVINELDRRGYYLKNITELFV